MKPEVAVAIVSAAISAIAAVISIASIYMSWQQAGLGRTLEERLNQQGAKIENRRFFPALWEKMVLVDRIDPNSPVEVDVRRALNTLELVALCWENDIVDKEMVTIAFGRNFLLRMREIEQITDPNRLPGLHRTGAELLGELPAISRVAPEIERAATQRVSI